MSGRAEQALANAAALGLSGFRPRQPDPTPPSSAQPAASSDGARGRAAMQVASRAGISGFAGEPAADQPMSARCSAILALAGQIGLAGFKRRDDACNVATRDGAEEAVATARRLRLPGFGDQAEAAPALSAPRAASPAPPAAVQPAAGQRTPAPAIPQATQPNKPVMKGEFAIVTIAPGGASAFAALERQMGRPFASTDSRCSTWLQHTEPDGTQHRAYIAAIPELAALRSLAGPLGSENVKLRIGSIARSDYSWQPPSANGSAILCMDVAVPAALRKALGR